jgi:AcrR family transcriptional regulator
MSAPTADPPSTSRDALIEAAITLMSRRSPSTISGRDLAAEAGVNYGLVHYYFESARDLMAEARRLHGDWIVENLMDGGTRLVDPEAALALSLVLLAVSLVVLLPTRDRWLPTR